MGKESWAPKEKAVDPILGKLVESSPGASQCDSKAEVGMSQAGRFSFQRRDL